MMQKPPHDFDAPVLVGDAPDEPFMLQRRQAINGRLIGGDLAGGLDFSNEGGMTVFGDVRLDIVEHRLLLLGEKRLLSQTGLRRWVKNYYRIL